MAQNTKEFLVKTIYDDAGLKQFEADAQKAKEVGRQLGVAFADSAKIIDQSVTTSLNKAGQSVRNVTSILEQGGKTAKVTFNEVGGVVKNTSANFTAFSSGLSNLTGEFSKLVSRAILVVPVWEALRFALKSLESTFIDAAKFMIEWETEMAKIRAITGATAVDIQILSGAILNVAEKFGISNTELGKSANEWLRMGASINTVVPLLETTAKLSLISGQSLADSAKGINGIMSAFGLNTTQAAQAIDKLIGLEEKSGVSLETMLLGFEKAGVKAHQSGISIDQLAGYIIAINQQSRQSGELIGSQLSSMFVRLGTTAVATAEAISKVPFYLDETGKATSTHTPILRNLNDIITELAASWKTLTTAQQDALAKALGGNLRQTAIISLFNNFGNALKATDESSKGLVDSQRAVGEILDTTANKVKQLQGAWGKLIEQADATGIMKNFLTNVKQGVDLLNASVGILHLTWDAIFNPKKLTEMLTTAKLAQAGFTAAGKPIEQQKANTSNTEEVNAQQNINSTLLTQEQIKQGLQVIEEQGLLTRQDKLDTIKAELALLGDGLTADGKDMSAQVDTLNIQKAKLEVERRILTIKEDEAIFESKMKAEGASSLQIDIQKLANLQLTGATYEEIVKQQAKVKEAAISQESQLQDSLISAILDTAKAHGATESSILSEQIALEDQLGIHKQGIDLLKEQLMLYKAITEESKKTKEQRLNDLQDLIKKTPSPFSSFGGNELSSATKEVSLRLQASQKGISDADINKILNPGANVSGGQNSLLDQIQKGLTDPLGTNITHLAESIQSLTQSIIEPQKVLLPSVVQSFKTPETSTTIGQSQFIQSRPGVTPHAGDNITVDIGGIQVTVHGTDKADIASQIGKLTEDLVAAHLVKPGSKVNKAGQKMIEEY